MVFGGCVSSDVVECDGVEGIAADGECVDVGTVCVHPFLSYHASVADDAGRDSEFVCVSYHFAQHGGFEEGFTTAKVDACHACFVEFGDGMFGLCEGCNV